MVHPWLLVGAGGFVGAILRYVAGGFIQKSMAVFPMGTLVINFSGSLALGLIMYSSEYAGLFDNESRLFLTIGVLGAYTTMSTFSYESFRLLDENQPLLFAANVLGTVASCILAVYLAKALVLACVKV
jgi:CrcB protein